jgi:rhodanese-related sulfurtransferase
MHEACAFAVDGCTEHGDSADGCIEGGRSNVWNLDGGVNAWQASGRSLVQKSRT